MLYTVYKEYELWNPIYISEITYAFEDGGFPTLSLFVSLLVEGKSDNPTSLISTPLESPASSGIIRLGRNFLSGVSSVSSGRGVD